MSDRAELLAGLVSAADEVALDALAHLPWPRYRGQAAVELVVELVNELGRNSFLSKRTQSERLRGVLVGLRLVEAEAPSFAAAARGFPPHLRQCAAEFVPPVLRRTLYESSHREGEKRLAREGRSASTLGEVQAQPPVFPGREPAETEGADGGRFSTILLLAHPDRVDANLRLLSARFVPLGVDLNALQQVLTGSDDVCGCVIDGTVLETLGSDEQRKLIADLAGYSTFMHVRIHDAGLLLARAEIERIIKQTRGLGGAVAHAAFSVQADYALRSSELDAFRHASNLLRSHSDAAFVLGELSSAESELLIAATRARIQAERLDGAGSIESATVRFLAGGRSGARLATVRVNSQTRTLVAKFATKEQALDEIRRFRTFIQEWDSQLAPEAYFHHNAAVILSSLVRSDEDRSTPAEPIEQRLTDLWNQQWMRTGSDSDLRNRADALGRGLKRLAHSLRDLNSSSPGEPGFECVVNPGLENLLDLEAGGFEWGLDEGAIRALTVAMERFKRLEHAGVVHGDLHLRNLLVRSDEEVHLIDYAASGPGHPAVDLVRLELALYLGPVRQFEVDSRCVDFQRTLTIERAPIDELRRRFPTFFQCHVNAACCYGMVAARDEVIEVLRAHGGDANDYITAKYLLAWQQLGLIGSHTGLARAILAALVHEVVAVAPAGATSPISSQISGIGELPIRAARRSAVAS